MAKYTKQDLYAAYAKHDREGLSELHEPGTDLDCAVCDEINRIAADLEGISVEELVNSNSVDSSSTEEAGYASPRVRMAPHVYKVSIDGNTYLWRVTTQRQWNQLQKQASADDMTEIPASEYIKWPVFTPRNSVISLAAYLHIYPKATGPIASLQSYQVTTAGLAARKPGTEDQWIYYDGTNIKEVRRFSEPLQASLTRKSKVQIAASTGSFSLSAGDYLLKLPTGRLLSFTTEEFTALYDIKDSSNWVIMSESV